MQMPTEMDVMQCQMNEMAKAALLQMESAVDDELDKVNNMTEDDLAKIRANRIAEMKAKAEKKQEWKHNGHGSLTKITEQKEFFDAAKSSEKLICIFTRESNRYGQMMKEHMTVLCQRHLEARFVWVDAENAPFLTDRLNIYMLPTIVCVKGNKVHKQHNGLDEIDGTGKYSTGTLEYLLHIDEMLDEAPLYDEELREEEEDLADIED
uniref:Thioredoxin domain-containing protein n=1 Tax=Coccolithus braarudii TaxID=221442 RepID=A0A7S0LHG4_9EUKA|mmetsp:Transcript_40777/g.86947  ORF Transcript_40777/g.86947 Transcript_40777/m.86947 type:complete len:208 (+) Transcript_40777:119-742(+)|eukprot:CAMPEP_0183353134 /NCGR_PEP_ID=MMETSP0164_2-20130417/32910_1 /TAXON_ID=221442 /ORGANISM="Coccolithus pelagicus ssp braarudi, Strain PLY182g" /LENGTH=207 /DNA_ID=CAMNT_0025525761 /DNA_START=118 /DNA_END=741 /DNA_ORIENTATION=-